MTQKSNSLLLVDSPNPRLGGSRGPVSSVGQSEEIQPTSTSIMFPQAIIRVEPPLRVILEQDTFTLKLLKEKIDALYSVLKTLLHAHEASFFSLKKGSQSIEIIIHHKIEDTEYQDFLENLSLLLDHNFTISTSIQTHNTG